MIHQKFQGIFAKVSVKHADGSVTHYDGFNNLITNAGLDWLGTSTAFTGTSHCRASSNADDPLVTDTTLSNQIGSASVTATNVLTNSGGTPEWFYQMERVYTFALGAVVGNVAKFGIFSAATGGTMFSSALVKDPVGVPTPITVTASDQLFVTWQLRKYVSITPITGNIDIGFDGVPTSVAYEIKPARLGNTGATYYFAGDQTAGNAALAAWVLETQTLGAVTGAPSGTLNQIGATLSSYSSGNYYRDITYTASTTQGNISGGVGSMVYGSHSTSSGAEGYQISFTPKLPKDADSTLSLPFRLSWGRA